MARALNKLSARFVATVREPGKYQDGGGLILVVGEDGRRWRFRYSLGGKRREMGLGAVGPGNGLAEAREAASQARALIRLGRDPIAARGASSGRGGAATFGAFADSLVESLVAGFDNPKHAAQWRKTFRAGDGYAASIRDRPLDAIDTADVLAVLSPLWSRVPETAGRVRGRIERVLDAAKAKGLRSGENPARWRGHLDALLPKRKRLTRGHFAAMPYADAPAFWRSLATVSGEGARALRFLILTAVRENEALGATWREVDGDLWTIPASRMKARKTHRVPLVAEALALIGDPGQPDALLFPGEREGRPLSNMTLDMILRRRRLAATVHGFRSTFRDWAFETTDHPREIVEVALAHVVGDATERAYRRGDALEKRRRLMADWARFLAEG